MDRIIGIMEETGFPFAYDHFAEGESPSPPFVCFRLPESNNFSADGKTYYKITRANIELYTDKKDLASEAVIESILDRRSISFEKSEVWISSEKLYEVLYEFEIGGNLCPRTK